MPLLTVSDGRWQLFKNGVRVDLTFATVDCFRREVAAV